MPLENNRPQPSAPTKPALLRYLDQVRDRKLGEKGFDYTFSDSRGTQHFGYTPQDRVGWNEVRGIVASMIAAGQSTATIDISTDTANITIQAQEWAAIELAGAQALQPVWQAAWPIGNDIKAGAITTKAEIDGDSRWP